MTNTFVVNTSDPEPIVGISQNYLYVLSAANVVNTQPPPDPQPAYLSIQWQPERQAFFQTLLQGRNLLPNADFSAYQASEIADWQINASKPAAIGVDFSEKWRLANGHTAYLYATLGAEKPILTLKQPIPIIASSDFHYQFSGFFGTHRAEGRIVLEFLDAEQNKLAEKTLRIPSSTKHLGGPALENYHFMHWSIKQPSLAAYVTIHITLGELQASATDSFLFVSHLFFGVSHPKQLTIWTPYSPGATQLIHQAHKTHWRAFGIAELPCSSDKQTVAINVGGGHYELTPEPIEIPDYICASKLNIRAQYIERLFDVQFYAKNQTNTLLLNANADDLFKHYQTLGWQINRSPSPYFDVAWYKVNTPELSQQTLEPLEHFVSQGSAALKSPHPLFDARWYYQTYLADSESSQHPLLHYLDYGWQLGYQPHPLFWTRWYEQQYLQAYAGTIDPFYHFLTEGWRQGFNPNPLFDIDFYSKHYGESHRLQPDPLSHYIHVGWRENLQPHSLFDPIYYAMHSGFNVEHAKFSPLQEFLEHKDSVSPHPLFDNEFVQEQFDKPLTCQALIAYLALDKTALIDPNPFFSKKYYYKHRNDSEPCQHDALIDYLERGWKTAQPVHPLFNARYYVEQNPKAKGCVPLQHYLVHGWLNGFSCRPNEDTKELAPKKPASTRIVFNMPDDRLLPRPNSAIQQNRRIGVFAHIFYPELSEEMLTACNHIPGNCRVFISTDTLIKAKEISIYCEQFSTHPFEIRVLPNRGRDIAPMICGYRDRINEVDYGVHIHSKRSSHFRSSFADGWRKHGIYGNLGSTELVQNILTVLADERIGAYAPDHYEAIRPAVQWTGNFSTVKQLMELAGEDISKDHHLDFPSGSMFWFKTQALKPLLDLKLRPFHFEAEQGQTDNTLAHALERSLFYFVEIAGYAWITGKRVSGAAAADSVLMLQTPGFNLNHVANRIFPTNKELGGLRRYFGNCTRFLARPSLITKPRINLLLPTLNQGQGHIDIDSALSLFNAIKHALGDKVDARIITTDVSPEQLFNPPEGYQLTTPHDKDQAELDVIADAAQRFRFPFFVRKADIFIATAWWTATHALDLLSQQDVLFGAQTRQFVYFIQDVEHSYYQWSSLSSWAEQSYKHPDKIIPVFQTEMVFEYFRQHGYFNQGYVAYPAMNSAIKSAITYQANKEKLVLLLVRPHIERFNTPFIDVMIRTAIDADPDFWADWRFLALGDHITATTFKTATEIEIIGEVSPQQYAGLASKAALGVALMASPQPSYAALELAEAGVLVLTNAYTNKNMALLHDNITSFAKFDSADASQQLKHIAEQWLADTMLGWQGQAHIDWFYDNAAKTSATAAEIAGEIQAKLV